MFNPIWIMTNMGSEMNGSERWLISLHAAFGQMLEKDHCSFGEIVLQAF